MKIILHIADAQKKFTAQDIEKIHSGISRAEKFTVPKLKIEEDIDLIVVPELPDFLIPEDKLGGRTYTGNFIMLSFAPNSVIEDLVYEVTCHELCHAARWQRNSEDMQGLFDGMILEGLAIVFEELAAVNQTKKQYFLKKMLERLDEENEDILAKVRKELDNYYYDYYSLFITGDKKSGIPRWAGYSLGYYLVKKYMSITNRSIEDIFAETFDKFRVVIK